MLLMTQKNLYILHTPWVAMGGECNCFLSPPSSSLCPLLRILMFLFSQMSNGGFLGLQHSVWLDDAFDRARQLYLSYYRSIPKSLERSTAHKLMLAMLGGDERFVEPTPKSLQTLTLQSVKDAVMNQFVGNNMEVHSYLLLDLFYEHHWSMNCI